MPVEPYNPHRSYLEAAMSLAEQAEHLGNLPIGAVIVLDERIIARGMNSIWKPQQELTRHAEMEALRAVPQELWPRAREMALYTTLEPCLMCAGAILLHGLGSLIFASSDPYGGAGSCFGALPAYFSEQLSLIRWEGPALSSSCDILYQRIRKISGF